MPRPRKDDFFASLRQQAQRALTAISAEIDRRERELKHLMDQARSWRSTLGIDGGARRAASAARGGTTRRARGSGAPVGKRVHWDEVLASVPKRFGVEDVMKHPGARAKGRVQIYPTLARWEAAKKIRRVTQGQYERVSGSKSQPSEKGRKTSRRRPQRRRSNARSKPSRRRHALRQSSRRRTDASTGRRSSRLSRRSFVPKMP
jgi:hypothetical protein